MNQPHLNHAIIASMLIVVLAFIARHAQRWSRFSTYAKIPWTTLPLTSVSR